MSGNRDECFFLYGFYGQGNLGDDLLLRATIDGIRRICPYAAFVIRNEGEVKGIDAYGGNIFLTGIDKILSDQSRSKFRRGIDTLVAYCRHFRKCGWFVFGGGTVFHERSSIAPLVLIAAICLLARLMGLRVVALGVGISELKSASARFVLRTIVRMSDLFAVRDDEAFAECVKAGVAQRVERTGDLAFSLVPDLTKDGHRRSADAAKRSIGFSIYPPALLDGASGQAAFEAHQQVITALLQRGWRISLLTFHDDPGKAVDHQDHCALSKLAASLAPGSELLITQHVLSADPATIARAFGSIDLHFGMRFHGHVLAAIFELPFAGISIDNKIGGICRYFGMPVVEIDHVSSATIVDAIDKALTVEIDRQLRDMAVLRAQENFSLLSKLYLDRVGRRGQENGLSR